MIDVIGIGSAVYDMLMLVDNLPQEDTKVQSSATRIQSGGPCSTALGVMSRLGLNVEYMGTLAADNLGITMLNDFEKYHIGSHFIRLVENCESFHSVVLINPNNATRTCVWNRGTVPSPCESDVNLAALRSSRYLYLDGHHHDAALFAAQKARQWGVKVVLDAGGMYPGMPDIVASANILIPSEEFALRYTGQTSTEAAARSIYAAHHPEILVVTQGRQGGFLFNGEQMLRYPAFDVHAIDTNSAGDVFHGAFVAAHARGMPVMDCACFASAVSAIKCTRFGARDTLPDFEQTLEFLRARGFSLNIQ